MTYYVNYIQDIIGNNYLGIKISQGIVNPFLKKLNDIIGDNDYKVYTENQQKRDRGDYHITVINAMEYNKLSNEIGMSEFINSLESIFRYPIDDLKMLGVGTATKNENRAFFIVCKSDKLDAIRTRYNLPKKDFHITIGFNYKDVFGVPKDEIITKYNKFIKLLSQEYYKNGDWRFVKEIENFNLDRKSDIIPVEINDTRVKFRCDGHFIDVVYIEDGEKFRIATKYPINMDLPRIPETEVKKLLKNNYE